MTAAEILERQPACRCCPGAAVIVVVEQGQPSTRCAGCYEQWRQQPMHGADDAPDEQAMHLLIPKG